MKRRRVWKFSIVETESLGRIEAQLKSIQGKLDTLLASTAAVSGKQLKELTRTVGELKAKSDTLEETIERNK